MAEKCGFKDKDTPPNFKVHKLCICCVQKLQPHDKSKVDVSPNTQSLYIRCSGLAWLCSDRYKLITTRRMIWNPKWLMKKEMYNGMLQNLVYSDCATNVTYQIEHFNINLVKQQPHMQTAAKIGSISICTLHIFDLSGTTSWVCYLSIHDMKYHSPSSLPPFPSLFLKGGGKGERKYKNPPPPLAMHIWPNLFFFSIAIIYPLPHHYNVGIHIFPSK